MLALKLAIRPTTQPSTTRRAAHRPTPRLRSGRSSDVGVVPADRLHHADPRVRSRIDITIVLAIRATK
jgi:hypothetical protein